MNVLPVHLTPEEIALLVYHPSYGNCLSLGGAEVMWRRIREHGEYVGFMLDMNQFHALNKAIGWNGANTKITTWLRTLRTAERDRTPDLVCGAGDEFLIVLPKVDEAGFLNRLDYALHACNLYACILRIELDPLVDLRHQFKDAADCILSYKARHAPARWMIWRQYSRVNRYRCGPNTIIQEVCYGTEESQ